MQQQPPALPARTTLVVMGVSGSGKSEISQAVATALGWRHIEADHFHPPENVERMRAGTPLSDEDRRHWLDALCEQMLAAQAAGECFVLACSALKRAYRERLRQAVPGLQFVHLDIDHATAVQRVGARPSHFMPTSLVDSQFATLESPAGEPYVRVVDAQQSRQALVAEIQTWVRREAAEAVSSQAQDMLDSEIDSANQAAQLGAEPIYEGRIARMFDRLTDGMMAVLMAFMVVAVFTNVVLRYAFGTGWPGAEELSRLAFVWLVFVGVASGMRRGELMTFRMVRDRFPLLAQRLVDSLSWILVAGASLLSALGAWNQVQFGWGNVSTVVGYPVVLAMLPVLASMLVLAILAVVQLINLWRRTPQPALSQAHVE
ncbi:gluconokinase, GntK/IdnK-type [Pseudomonas sediminis]|uniref:gluconokinase, GntK/IdnK-type n=1 Tax=Pseudomonas sediminis TaxID=1691904 RepID=UPI0031CCB2C8